MKIFAERLRKLGTEKGLSQAELARELDVASNTVSIWELGKRMPEEKTIKQIAAYFLTTEEYLLGKSEYPDLDSMVEELKRAKMISSNLDENLEHTEEQLLLMYRDLRDERREQSMKQQKKLMNMNAKTGGFRVNELDLIDNSTFGA